MLFTPFDPDFLVEHEARQILFERWPKGCAFSGASMPDNLGFNLVSYVSIAPVLLSPVALNWSPI